MGQKKKKKTKYLGTGNSTGTGMYLISYQVTGPGTWYPVALLPKCYVLVDPGTTSKMENQQIIPKWLRSHSTWSTTCLVLLLVAILAGYSGNVLFMCSSSGGQTECPEHSNLPCSNGILAMFRVPFQILVIWNRNRKPVGATKVHMLDNIINNVASFFNLV